ncbi:hypothetical protein FNV43_RR24414 [Rhamnella rubrinervis]|uniref:Amino acid transporter transmembrane domain-containing protein n=1 Tax=Rhamnella rubrinervis TaxID=2594499 RepID=A0A8K0DY20_9ROSA|nr:hypothetical protein FNV43_RR24414 [Rhamnella rubrinervis]
MKEKQIIMKDGAADAPLLQNLERQASQGGASFAGSILNISTTMIGSGVMSIPAAIKVLGIVPGFLLIFIVALTVEVTVDFLLRNTRSGKSNTYAGIVAESFGRLGSLALQICVVVSNLGSLIIYFIIVGDVLCGSQSGGTVHIGILQEWFGIHWWNSRACALLFIALFVMLPLVMFRQVDSLKHSSGVSMLLALVFIAISSALAIYALCKGKTQQLRLFPDFAQVSVFDLFTAVPVIVMALAFHVNVHPIRAELGDPSDMKSAVRISIIICVVIFLVIGFFGYLLFGDSIMPDMLVNFDQNSDSTIRQLLNDIVRLSYAIHILLVYPIYNFSLRANIDELLFPNKQVFASDTPRFVSLTCVLLAFTYIVAIAIPDIWIVFQFLGSTTLVCIAFIFPGAIILRNVNGISTRRDKVIAALVIVMALVTSVVAISTNVYGSVKKKRAIN